MVFPYLLKQQQGGTPDFGTGSHIRPARTTIRHLGPPLTLHRLFRALSADGESNFLIPATNVEKIVNVAPFTRRNGDAKFAKPRS